MKYRINFGDVKIGEIAKKNVLDCLEKHWVTHGDKVIEFERKFCELAEYKYGVMVNSGTSADFLACLSLYDRGAKRGQKIIVPALSFIATQNSIITAGFVPVPVDINRYTLNINEDLIEDKINDDVVAIMCVNTMGKPCNMRKLRDLCDKHNLILICDNCEGHFCRFEGKQMSHWADIVTYSFYSAHVLFSVQGGFVGTNNSDIYDSVISTRTHGRRNGEILFFHEKLGWNAQPTDLHASIGLESLGNAINIFESRKKNLLYMMNKLIEKKLDSKFILNLEEEDDVISPHALSLTFREDNEERFLKFYKYMDDNGIQVKLNFKSVFTQQKAMEWMGYKLGDFTESEFVGRNGLHLSCSQFLSKDDLDFIVDTIERFDG